MGEETTPRDSGNVEREGAEDIAETSGEELHDNGAQGERRDPHSQPKSSVLKDIPIKGGGGDEKVITFKTDELTAHCPFDFGGPDFYVVTIRYVPSAKGVESKSLKQYIESWRDVRMTVEDIAQTIYDDIDNLCSPDELYIGLDQSRRGGIDETVEVGDLHLRPS